ncbi:hypothetical protein [Methanosarcina sp.]|uniref:hypothetical protein n=1 Tax=Methanosarcina sp. TaxID=2213 RepID=UPI003C77980F
MKKISLISLLLVMLLITSGLSGCIGQEKPVEDNNTSTPSYNSTTQSGHPSFLSMLFWSSLWNRHVTSNFRAAKAYVTPDPATKTDASDLSRKVDAKDPTDTTGTTNKNSLIQDTGNRPKTKVKTTTPRIRRSGRR